MAHFAELGLDNIVLRVVVVSNDILLDGDGNEDEQLGKNFLNNLYGGTWVKTSYNATVRKNFGAKGYTYDSTRDAFIPPKPYASWTLDETTCQWEAPTAYPTDGNDYRWDEATTSWVQI